MKDKRVLVVDDDVDLRGTFVEVLRLEISAKIFSAEHGMAALDWMKCHGDPDLILLDLRMPVMDGEAFIEAYDGPARIILLTADHGIKTIRGAERVYKQLSKPVDIDVLILAILHAFDIIPQ